MIKDLRVCQHKSLQTDRKLDITRANLNQYRCNWWPKFLTKLTKAQKVPRKTHHVLNFEVLKLSWEPKLLHDPRILPCSKPALNLVYLSWYSNILGQGVEIILNTKCIYRLSSSDLAPVQTILPELNMSAVVRGSLINHCTIFLLLRNQYLSAPGDE